MIRTHVAPLLAWAVLGIAVVCPVAAAQAPTGQPAAAVKPEDLQEVKKGAEEAKGRGDTAWVLASSGLVMLMLPGLALFYGGMVRRKNILATMMHSMVALAVVGVYWVAVGYSLAFGDPWLGDKQASLLGWSGGLFFLVKTVERDTGGAAKRDQAQGRGQPASEGQPSGSSP